MSEVLNKIEDVDIDPSGVFKYVLIEVKDKDVSKQIVRGYSRCDYHGELTNILLIYKEMFLFLLFCSCFIIHLLKIDRTSLTFLF